MDSLPLSITPPAAPPPQSPAAGGAADFDQNGADSISPTAAGAHLYDPSPDRNNDEHLFAGFFLLPPHDLHLDKAHSPDDHSSSVAAAAAAVGTAAATTTTPADQLFFRGHLLPLQSHFFRFSAAEQPELQHRRKQQDGEFIVDNHRSNNAMVGAEDDLTFHSCRMELAPPSAATVFEFDDDEDEDEDDDPAATVMVLPDSSFLPSLQKPENRCSLSWDYSIRGGQGNCNCNCFCSSSSASSGDCSSSNSSSSRCSNGGSSLQDYSCLLLNILNGTPPPQQLPQMIDMKDSTAPPPPATTSSSTPAAPPPPAATTSSSPSAAAPPPPKKKAAAAAAWRSRSGYRSILLWKSLTLHMGGVFLGRRRPSSSSQDHGHGSSFSADLSCRHRQDCDATSSTDHGRQIKGGLKGGGTGVAYAWPASAAEEEEEEEESTTRIGAVGSDTKQERAAPPYGSRSPETAAPAIRRRNAANSRRLKLGLLLELRKKMEQVAMVGGQILSISWPPPSMAADDDGYYNCGGSGGSIFMKCKSAWRDVEESGVRAPISLPPPPVNLLLQQQQHRPRTRRSMPLPPPAAAVINAAETAGASHLRHRDNPAAHFSGRRRRRPHNHHFPAPPPPPPPPPPRHRYTSSFSSVQDLHSAVQSAIAHCKESNNNNNREPAAAAPPSTVPITMATDG